jgi:hypothetical protein
MLSHAILKQEQAFSFLYYPFIPQLANQQTNFLPEITNFKHLKPPPPPTTTTTGTKYKNRRRLKKD